MGSAACGRTLRSSQAGLEVAWASPAILTRLCPSSRAFSFSICYLLGRVARCFLAAACCLAARRARAQLPPPARGKWPCAAPFARQRSPQSGLHAGRMAHHKQRAMAVFKKEKRGVYCCLVVMKQSAADRKTIWWTEPPHVQLHVGCKEELEPCGEWLHVVHRFHPSDKGCVFLATDLGV